MTKEKIVGLLLIFAMGIPSVAFAKEAAWWTRHKQVCELPKDLGYQDWLDQGSPCDLNAIAERKQRENARKKKIRNAEQEAKRKVTQAAQEIAREKEQQAAQLAQEQARKKEIQIAEERARKKEAQLAKKIARDEAKQLARERALEKKALLAEQKARLKAVKSSSSDTANRGKSSSVARRTSDVAKPYVSTGAITAESIASDLPSPTASSTHVSVSELLARMVKHSRSQGGVGEVVAEACAGLGLCDGSANMPVKLVVGETPGAKLYFGVPLAESAEEILIMVEAGTVTEVYLTDLNGILWASTVSDTVPGRSIPYKVSSDRFDTALNWFVQAARQLKPTN